MIKFISFQALIIRIGRKFRCAFCYYYFLWTKPFKKFKIVTANPFAAKYGTPLPIALNEFVSEMFSGIIKLFGSD
jgi:hypothetical protein